MIKKVQYLLYQNKRVNFAPVFNDGGHAAVKGLFFPDRPRGDAESRKRILSFLLYQPTSDPRIPHLKIFKLWQPT